MDEVPLYCTGVPRSYENTPPPGPYRAFQWPSFWFWSERGCYLRHLLVERAHFVQLALRLRQNPMHLGVAGIHGLALLLLLAQRRRLPHRSF